MEHKPLPFPEHLNSQSVFSCVRVTQSLVFYIVFCIFVYHCMSFSFSVLFLYFGQCIVICRCDYTFDSNDSASKPWKNLGIVSHFKVIKYGSELSLFKFHHFHRTSKKYDFLLDDLQQLVIRKTMSYWNTVLPLGRVYQKNQYLLFQDIVKFVLVLNIYRLIHGLFHIALVISTRP